MKISCIYIIKSKVKPERFYIGSALDLNKRRGIHYSSLNRKKHHSSYLQNHVNKYGVEDIYFEILETVEDINMLISKEQSYIDALNPTFNILKKAGSMLGYKFSETSRLKMSEKRKLRVTKDSTKLKLSVARKGTKLSDAVRKKISEANRKRKYSDETKKKIGDGNRGKIISQETRDKNSAALKGGSTSKAKPVYNLYTSVKYHSAKQAAVAVNMDYEKLRNMLRGLTNNITNLRY